MLIRAQFFCSHPAGRDRSVFPTEQAFVVPDVVEAAMASSGLPHAQHAWSGVMPSVLA